jgi:hypothetical protein
MMIVFLSKPVVSSGFLPKEKEVYVTPLRRI